jgi:hypothetical protein
MVYTSMGAAAGEHRDICKKHRIKNQIQVNYDNRFAVYFRKLLLAAARRKGTDIRSIRFSFSRLLLVIAKNIQEQRSGKLFYDRAYGELKAAGRIYEHTPADLQKMEALYQHFCGFIVRFYDVFVRCRYRYVEELFFGGANNRESTFRADKAD